VEPALRVAAELEGKVLAVRVTLDDRQARLVVDTGAGTSAISLACARTMGLRVESGLRVRTPTGLIAVGTVCVASLRLGSLQMRDARLAAVPLHNDRIDGLLGLDFFRAVGARSVTLDLDAAELEVRLGSG
jgi:predicted aspartyl protease